MMGIMPVISSETLGKKSGVMKFMARQSLMNWSTSRLAKASQAMLSRLARSNKGSSTSVTF